MKYAIDSKGFAELFHGKSKEDKLLFLDIMINSMNRGDTPKLPWIKKLPEKKTKRKVISYPLMFEKFWADYPRKTGKGLAFKAWQQYDDPSVLMDRCLSALRWQCKSADWLKDNGQFIPLPATYLNQSRFDDEPKKSSNNNKVY